MKTDQPSQSSTRKAFKDYFDKAAVVALAQQFKAVWAEFPRQAFQKSALRQLESLEFSQRVSRLSDCLKASLPDDVPEALSILRASLPAPLANCDSVTDGWLQWPLGQFIADYGIDHFDESMLAMIELTQVFSAEFAVRPFVIQFPERTIERLTELCQHKNAHVRRWCSEGVRPRLPWGSVIRSLVNDPAPMLPILDALHDDDELYVRRSVANNLNDVSKDHPQVVVDRCVQYHRSQSAHATWVTRHALRTLIKNGDRNALAVLGYHPPKDISAQLSVAPAQIMIGESVELTAVLQSNSKTSQLLAVDFELTFVRQNQKSSAKVFKWKTFKLSSGDEVVIKKRHPVKTTTVRRLFPGRHEIRLMVNGTALAEAGFQLQSNISSSGNETS
ncbi:MAG: DNA alkylation repair protein [Fuerstiella sp.]